MKLSRFLFLAVLLSAFPTHYIYAAPEQAKAPTMPNDTSTPETIAAVLDGSSIKISDIDEEIKRKPNLAVYLQMAEGNPGLLQRVRAAALDGMINRKILLDEAKKSGSTDEAEVKKSVAKMLSEFESANGGKEQFLAGLKSIGTTPERFEADISDDIRLNSFIDKVIAPNLSATDEELKASFETHPEKYGKPEEVRARHILIKVPEGDSAKDAEAKKKIDAIYEEVKKPGADFGEIAKAKSECPSAPRGGDLGFFPRGAMVPEFEKAAFAMKVGETGAPIKTKFGYHIIKVEERHEGGKPEFDKVKDSVKKDVIFLKRDEKVKAKITELRKARNVEIKLSPGPV